MVWDSGKVRSANTAFEPYGGPALASGSSFRWEVRTWDRTGRISPWAGAKFDTGLAAADWQAGWIRRTTAEKDDYTLARKDFRVAGGVVRARLYVSASQQYRAYLNGKLVDRGPAFAYPGEGYYQVTDVTKSVGPGAQALGVFYHWYGPGQGRPAGEPGLVARLVIDHANGDREVVTSDGTWRTTQAPWLAAAYRNGDGRDYVENVDGRLAGALEGWSVAGFDDSGWAAAQVADAVPVLRAQQTRLSHDVVRPVSITTLPSGAVVADFGTVIPASPRVRFRSGTAGQLVTMVAGYLLNPDGTVSNSPQDNQSTDLSYSYVQRDGDQTFDAFTYEGFRYLQLSAPGDIAAVVQHTDVDPARAATFDSSDATVDAVVELMQRSALYSSQEQFLDTPTREKGQFLADSVNISRALMGGSGDRAFTAKAIREFLASQQRYWPDGRLNAVYPNGDGKRDIPDFTEMFPSWVEDYYVASGDRALLAEAYPAVAAIADYVRRYRDPATGLVTNLAGGSGAYLYGIIDWPNRYGYDTATAARTTVNILAVDVLRSAARQAEELGLDPGSYRADAAALATAINTRLRRTDGIYLDGLGSTHASQIANAYALAYGLTSDKSVADHVVSLGLQMGPMTADMLLRALHRAGRNDQVVARLTDESLGWANILARGGTFTWESWEAPERGESMSHGWGAAALTEVQRDLLGVTVTGPAARTLTIAPPRGTDLTHAAGSVWTQAGRVTVRWGAYGLVVDLPVNTTAEVHVPATRRPLASGAVRFLGLRDGAAVYEVGSGRSSFRIR
ncbi:family 78 glycoside hydrolase catalytic domain [Symbioplanes lichenis]|uniref:family 78 glycoside hydrolase catalytic domain n=1 Tax=Symbioplanes lichenis TaxID=1629072 RepID=UPI0027384170|nr:family 78 glycoside hydrolase catalytic domain [Actinoplanes lichenis]